MSEVGCRTLATSLFDRSGCRCRGGNLTLRIVWRCGLWLTLTLADLSVLDFPDRSLAFTTIVPAPSSTTTTSAASAFAILTIAVARGSDAM